MTPLTSTRGLTGALGAALMVSATHCGSGGPHASPSVASAPEVAWSTTLGGAAAALGGAAVAADGSTRVAGSLSTPASMGSSMLEPAGGTDVLIAKVAGDGEVLWAHVYGDAANQSASAVAVDRQGDTIVVGTFAGTLDLSAPNAQVIQSTLVPGPGPVAAASPLHAQGSTDGFVAKLDPDGNLLWATPIGSVGATTEARSLAVSPDGRIVVAGSYVGPAVLPSLRPSTTTTAFATALDAAGAVMWATPFGVDAEVTATSIGLDAQDDVFLAGTSRAPGSSSGPRPSGELTKGTVAAFIAKFSADGLLAWDDEIGAVSSDGGISLGVDASGNALLLANYGVLSPGATAGELVVGPQMHLVKYDRDGGVVWADVYGSPGGGITGDALAVDAAGNAYVAGHLGEQLSFGRCTLLPAADGASAAFVGRIDPDGTPTCAVKYGTSGTTRIHAMAPTSANGIVMTGHFTGSVDLGQGPLQAGSDTSFVAVEDESLEVVQ